MAGLAALLTAFSLGLGLARDPYVGIACHRPNSTACGRVGIAVWLSRPHAKRIEATLAGAQTRLTPPRSAGGFWVGFVRLPQRRLALPASWAGTPARRLTLTLRIRYPDGWHSGTIRVPLSPGWG